MKVVIAGTGYVGLITGVCLANIGHKVICVDKDKDKISKLNSGIPPIYEKGLLDLMQKNKNRLKYTTNSKEAYSDSDIIFVGVGTPENSDGSANLNYVYDVINDIINYSKNECIIVIKSTVPIGTNDEIEKYIKKINDKKNIIVVSNPEFLSQGNAIHDTLYASRIIIGTNDEKAILKMQELYKPLTKEPYSVPIFITDRRSAEMIKYASNSFLALKISYMNEIANLCEKMSANIDDVKKGMSYDERIGDKFLNAGIGFGGSCFPKDTKALLKQSKENDIKFKTLEACIEVNKKQKLKLLSIIFNKFPVPEETIISMLGASFKPETDDVREAPAIDNVQILLEKGYNVKIYDPIAIKNFENVLRNKMDKNIIKKLQICNTLEECVYKSDAIMIMTEWNEIKNINIKKLKENNDKIIILDGRNCLPIDDIKNNDVEYYSIGRK